MTGFENLEAFARMNHLIDYVRGKIKTKNFDDLGPGMRDLYNREPEVAEYVITVDDIKQISSKLK